MCISEITKEVLKCEKILLFNCSEMFQHIIFQHIFIWTINVSMDEEVFLNFILNMHTY